MLQILLVDESNPFRDALKHLLQNRYPESVVEQVATCRESEEKIASMAPHIVFINIHLTDGKALALAKTIKSLHPDITLMGMADCDLPEYHVASRRAGIDFFVPRDQWTGEKLLALVDSILMKPEGPPPELDLTLDKK